MPKEAFGGDDEGAPPEVKKKMSLDRYGLKPDTNIRDLFWKIMGSYAATKKPGVDLAALEHDRFALMRVALSILSSPHCADYGLSPRFIAQYTLMMLLDGGWSDALVEFLEDGAQSRTNLAENIGHGLRKLAEQESYLKVISETLGRMIRGRESGGTALAYLASMERPDLAAALKRELIILARGDIGENQLNAIRVISGLKDDQDVKKAFITLLTHWDNDARRAAAEALLQMKDDSEVKAAAAKRLAGETDPGTRKILEKIVK